MGSEGYKVSTATVVKVGICLTLIFAAMGSVRFARFDWTGLPLDRSPVTDERQVGPCLEKIKPYVTESGRTIKPVVVDEMQYLSLVEHFRGVPDSELQVTCFYDPFTFRSGISWMAHWLPFDEALSLGMTNSIMTILGIWIVLFALREQRFSERALIGAGIIYTLSWNLFYFGSALLIDSGVVAALALCWYLLARKSPWLTLPLIAVGYTLRDSFAIIIVVLWAWCWKQYRETERSKWAAFAPALTATVLFIVSIKFWREVLPDPVAAWDVTPRISTVFSNLGDPVGLVTLAIGTLPMLLPAYFVYRRSAVEQAWFRPLTEPAMVGALMALGIMGWTVLTAALSPRTFWIGFPFGATLVAQWLSTGRPKERLDSIRLPFVTQPVSADP
ncbi:MAG: hypothetical protein KDB26_09510 [Microthrixaceae bacterium]|nr:hypothetical protein [Microthrixaceae bacterium]